MPTHTVQPGDCFNSIAKEHGFYNYLTLYEHGENASIKGNRKNPNMLVEGDAVAIPAKRQKKVALDLDKDKKFVVDRKKTKLRLALKDCEDRNLPVTEVKLVVGSLTSTAKPNDSGLIEVEVDPSVKAGTLSIKPLLLKKPVPPERPVAGPEPEKPPHPPKITAKEFTDEPLAEDKTPVELEIALKIGFLEPHTEVRGALQRLNNLGCKVPDATARTADDDAAKRVIKSYQKYKGEKDPSGAIADVQSGLEASHDKV